MNNTFLKDICNSKVLQVECQDWELELRRNNSEVFDLEPSNTGRGRLEKAINATLNYDVLDLLVTAVLLEHHARSAAESILYFSPLLFE